MQTLYFTDGGYELGLEYDSEFGGLFSGITKWVKNACRTAGRALASVAKTVTKAISLVGKIPIVGPFLHGVLSLATVPFNMMAKILSGVPLNKAALGAFRDTVSAIREVAPMVKMIVTMIPGIGIGIGAGLAAAEALASGQSIGDALIAGVKGALPGGVIAKVIFDFSSGAIQGRNIAQLGLEISIRNLPITATAKAVLMRTSQVIVKAAMGNNIAKSAFEEARGVLPPEAATALDVGIAIGQGKKLQNIVISEIDHFPIDKMGKLVNIARASIEASPVLKAGQELVKKIDRHGYEIGLGLTQCAAVTEEVVMKVRAKLNPKDFYGFDMAVAAHIGGVVSKPPPAGMPAAARAGYYVTRGMIGAQSNQKVAVMKIVATHPVARQGAKVALTDIAIDRKDESWIEQILRTLRLA